MKFSLQQQIYFFTLSSCFLFLALVISILWSTQIVDVALKRENYAHKVEDHTNILKQFIHSENIYGSDYNTDNWLFLESKFTALLRLAPLSLTPQQQTIQNSIEHQNKNVVRLFNTITENKLKNANEIIKKHFKIRLIAQLESIRSDSIQLSSIVQKDIKNIIQNQVISILSILLLGIFIIVFGAYRLAKIFGTSLKEVKMAFEKNHSGRFQKIQLSNQSEEFNSIVQAFNTMNEKLSVTTVSLETMKKIVEERTHELERLSNTDPLTKIANRRALFERGNAELSRVQRTKSKLAIIMIDCDLFKNINDQFGHLFGDEVLKNLCKICAEEIRKIDFLARYGGEEFIIILPDSDVSDAMETAKRIQRSLSFNCIAFEGKEVSMTVSIGISTVSDIHTDFTQLISDADIAMYKAKSNGRNRIEIRGENVSH
jgi:diguanylate cyclase (GGDEF)-like protein